MKPEPKVKYSEKTIIIVDILSNNFGVIKLDKGILIIVPKQINVVLIIGSSFIY
jgi:hypothetical protein